MVYLKIPIGNEALEDTTFIQIYNVQCIFKCLPLASCLGTIFQNYVLSVLSDIPIPLQSLPLISNYHNIVITLWQGFCTPPPPPAERLLPV